MKKCSQCKVEWGLESFYKDHRAKDGLHSHCKSCQYIRVRKMYSDNPSFVLKVKATRKKWVEKNHEKVIEYSRKYLKLWRMNNLERCRAFGRKWRVNNKEKVNAYMKKMRKNPKYCIDKNIGVGVYRSLKGKKAGNKWETLVGYTLKDLITRLEGMFDSKMSWENYGSYWELDHIKPISLFNYIFPEEQEFKDCWALENLQPLEKRANRIKRNHYQL